MTTRRKSSSSATRTASVAGSEPSGHTGWDEYAAFYDWENARTMARRDIAFWERLAHAAGGPILELGCGTGRVTLPLARATGNIVGVDRSAPMLDRARERVRRARLSRRARLVRADIRDLPFESSRFALVAAPYGVLQSLLKEADLSAALTSVTRVLAPGGRLVLELVADLPSWQEYKRATRLRGWRPGGKAHVTLVESVRQDPARGLTMFDQEFTERRGSEVTRRQFSLAFRTLSPPQMARRLARAGLSVSMQWGSYEGDPWTQDAETWIVGAEKPARSPRRRPPGA